MNIELRTFSTIAECLAYIEWLIDNGLQYHFDDNLSADHYDWRGALTDEQADIMEANNENLWDFCNPWDLMEDGSDLWTRYIG
jgi:hypothetical protein